MTEQNKKLRDYYLKQDRSKYKTLEALLSIAYDSKDHKLSAIPKRESLKQAHLTKDTKMYELYRKCLLFDADTYFDDFMLYIEFDRPPAEKFYIPRRNTLFPVVKDLQDLADGIISIYTLSMPPGTGKSTLGMFFIAWLMLRNPKKPNAMGAYSGGLTKQFYQRLLNILEDNITYSWRDVFPNIAIKTSADEKTIDLMDETTSKRRVKNNFPSTTCRGVDGSWTGTIRVEQCLYLDDIIEGMEEALSSERLQKKYDKYANQMKDRKKEGAFELHIGTRWHPHDVIGRVSEQYKNDPTFRSRTIPALDENGESNFDYPYNLGFSTKWFLDMKDSIESAEWEAKYMGEPFLRDGILLDYDSVNWYNGILPDCEPDEIVSWCDVAVGGGDNLSMPFLYRYGEKIFVHDWIFSPDRKDVTRPIVKAKILTHTPNQSMFEEDGVGDSYADTIIAELRAEGRRLNIGYRKAAGKKNKHSRILSYETDIRNLYFIDYKNSSPMYREGMRNLTIYPVTGKVKHDDAPDSLAGALELLLGRIMGSAESFKRPF